MKKSKAAADGEPSAKKSKKAAKAEGEEAAAAEPQPEAPAADPNSLDNFALSPAVRTKLREAGINALFPIQAATFSIVMNGQDLVGRARTGQARCRGRVLAHSAAR